jgi:hypothetical protein
LGSWEERAEIPAVVLGGKGSPLDSFTSHRMIKSSRIFNGSSDRHSRTTAAKITAATTAVISTTATASFSEAVLREDYSQRVEIFRGQFFGGASKLPRIQQKQVFLGQGPRCRS